MIAALKSSIKRVFGDVVAVLASGIILSIAALPIVWLVYIASRLLTSYGVLLAIVGWAILFGLGYIAFGASLLITVVLLRQVFSLGSQEGSMPFWSPASVRFAILHGMLRLARVSFLWVIRGTSLINLFYRGMGATIGKRTIINTVLISDCDLITVGQDCVIGGDAVINGHSVERGNLVRKRVVLGDRVTIGQSAIVLPGVVIENDVVVAGNSLVPKYRTLQAGRTYAGVPVRFAALNPDNEVVASRGEPFTPPFERDGGEGQILDANQLDLQSILLESYKLRHGEILEIVRFMSRVVVTSLGLCVTTFMYSVLNQQPRLLLILPPLAGITGIISLHANSAMQRLGYKAAEIEIMFKQARVEGFDWELKYGVLGSARMWDLDALVTQMILASLFIGGIVVTWRGGIVVSSGTFLGVGEQNILLALDALIALWAFASLVYLLVRQRRFKAALRGFEERGRARLALERPRTPTSL